MEPRGLARGAFPSSRPISPDPEHPPTGSSLLPHSEVPLKLLFLGDVVGTPGRRVLAQCLPSIISAWSIDLVVCNAENSAGGSGLTPKCHRELLAAGVDAITMGDHIYRRAEIFPLLEAPNSSGICRPANLPSEAPGAEFLLVPAPDGTLVGVFTLLGRIFTKPVDCPFRAADRVLERILPITPRIVVDFHAEATSEKQLMGRYLDGRVSAVLGTHTHVATADEQILPGGTAYQTDVGMTGPHDSIIGRRIDQVLATTLSHVPRHFDVATGDPRIHGAVVTIHQDTGRALTIERLAITPANLPNLRRPGS